jgi:solute carrier family 40 (iron-regulated transporter), member 1
VYGFCVTGTGILFSGSVGNLIDNNGRLNVVRCATVGQKISSGLIYALFLLYFLTPIAPDGRMTGRSLAAFVGIVLCGAILKVSTVGLTISIERDWASTIGRGSSQRLTKLNTWIRRIVRACLVLFTLISSSPQPI